MTTWQPYHRIANCEPSPNYPQYDNGKPGYLPKRTNQDGLLPLRSLSSKVCQDFCDYLNANHADKTIPWFRDHWNDVVVCFFEKVK